MSDSRPEFLTSVTTQGLRGCGEQFAKPFGVFSGDITDLVSVKTQAAIYFNNKI